MVRGLSQRRLLLAAVLQCLHLPVMRHSPPAASDARGCSLSFMGIGPGGCCLAASISFGGQTLPTARWCAGPGLQGPRSTTFCQERAAPPVASAEAMAMPPAGPTLEEAKRKCCRLGAWATICHSQPRSRVCVCQGAFRACKCREGCLCFHLCAARPCMEPTLGEPAESVHTAQQHQLAQTICPLPSACPVSGGLSPHMQKLLSCLHGPEQWRRRHHRRSCCCGSAAAAGAQAWPAALPRPGRP